MNGSPLGADLLDESVIKEVASREDWNSLNHQMWELSRASFLNDLGVHDLRLRKSVDVPRSVALISRLLDELPAEVYSSAPLTPILDAIVRLENDLRRRAGVRIRTAKQTALEEIGYTLMVERDADSGMWVGTAQRTPTDEDSGHEPESISLAPWDTELEAAEEGLEFLRRLPDSPEADAETHY